MVSPFRPQVRRTAIFLSVAVVAGALIDSASQAGIQGSGFRRLSAFARVTSFDGSVVIDGEHFDSSRAKVRIDDRPGTVSELEPGQLVAVEGEIGPDGVAVATDLAYASDVRGVVSKVNDKAGTLVVLGQPVRVVDSTLFGDGIHPARLKGLREGFTVAVSAFRSASGELIASRIDLANPLSLAQTRGEVTALNGLTRTFRINDLTVAYAGALVQGALVDGAVATVRGASPGSAGPLVATEVEVSAGAAAAAGTAAAIEGVITRFDSGSSFEVNGARIATSADTVFELNDETLQLDQRVGISGTFDAAGALVADRVSIEPQSLTVVEGFVEAVSAGEATLRVQGLDVQVDAATILEDRARHPLHDFQLSDVRVGDFVEARGLAQASARLSATVLQRENPPTGAAKHGGPKPPQPPKRSK